MRHASSKYQEALYFKVVFSISFVKFKDLNPFSYIMGSGLRMTVDKEKHKSNGDLTPSSDIIFPKNNIISEVLNLNRSKMGTYFSGIIS